MTPSTRTVPQFLTDLLRVPRDQAFAERLGRPEWTYVSTTQMFARARAIAYGVRDAGIGAGDRVALMANNRLDWIAADFGLALAGCVVVPIFPTLALDQVDYIVNDSATQLIIVESPADAARLRERLPQLPRIISFDGTGPDTLGALEARGATLAAEHPEQLANFSASLSASDLAVLIYTSGTTGDPKGVMLTHANIVQNTEIVFTTQIQGLDVVDKPLLSVLPYSHIYEHTDIFGYLFVNANVYVTQPDFFIDDMRSCRPVGVSIVPRFFERMLAAVLGNAKAQGGTAAQAVPWALDVARRHATALADGLDPGAELTAQYAQAQPVIAAIRAGLGIDRLLYFATGSAPLHRDITLTFAGLGIFVFEGYGLTESTSALSISTIAAHRYGSVGKPIPGVEVKFADDGEILVKGHNIMRGYRRDNDAFTPDGYFKTGDIGTFDADGFLYITDRKKELIKTSAGKYVAPSRVEAAIRRSAYIGQCFVIGDERPFPIALVAPDWAAIRREFSIAADVPTAEIAARADVRTFLENEAAQKTADMAKFEQIRRIVVLPRDLTIADGELSPTMKVKRRVVERTYANLIDAAYAAPAPVPAEA
jgi:long-chain acyl-CoA synthetase